MEVVPSLCEGSGTNVCIDGKLSLRLCGRRCITEWFLDRLKESVCLLCVSKLQSKTLLRGWNGSMSKTSLLRGKKLEEVDRPSYSGSFTLRDRHVNRMKYFQAHKKLD